jgi:hypothetical protein
LSFGAIERHRLRYNTARVVADVRRNHFDRLNGACDDVVEAAELQADLERGGIHPWAWIINNFAAAAAPTAPLLRHHAALNWIKSPGCVTNWPTAAPSSPSSRANPSA